MPKAALLRGLLDPELMKERLRVFTMVDAIVAPDMRSFEWHPAWKKREQMGAYKDGSGNFFFAWFSPKGAVIRGFDHESKLSPFRKRPPEEWPGLFDGFPPALEYARREPAFVLDEITFAMWTTGRGWRAGAVKTGADGSDELLSCFRPNYAKWAEETYGEPLHPEALRRIWWHREPIDRATIDALNPNADLATIREEAKLTGFALALDRKAPALPPAAAKPPKKEPRRSFGSAEFVVRCEPTRVRMLIGKNKVVAESKLDVYEELFDLVKAKLKAARAKP